jgi:hypothetical protein
MIVNSGHLSCINVLKRFGAGNPAPLSFPMRGWTLTVDLPIEHGLDKLCDALDTEVIAAGGRVYLAKDSRLSAAAFRKMYPRLDEFPRRTSRSRSGGDLQFRSCSPAGTEQKDDRRCGMINAVGAPQSLLLLGGTSDIALAIAHRYARPGLRVVLAARPSERRSAAAAELKDRGCEVTEVDLDARDHESHAGTIELAFAGGDIDIAVIAFGLLGDPEQGLARS